MTSPLKGVNSLLMKNFGSTNFTHLSTKKSKINTEVSIRFRTDLTRLDMVLNHAL